jgi:hypothetical protein
MYIATWGLSGNDGSWAGDGDLGNSQVWPGEEYTFRIELAGGQQPDMAYRFIMVEMKDGQQSFIGNWSDDYRFDE